MEDFSALLRFCSENDLCACEYVRDCDELDDYIEDNLYDWVRSMRWTEVRDTLESINTNYDYYDVEYEIEGIDYEFERYKQATLEEADTYNLWDDAEEDEEPSEYGLVVEEDDEISTDEFEELFAGVA